MHYTDLTSDSRAAANNQDIIQASLFLIIETFNHFSPFTHRINLVFSGKCLSLRQSDYVSTTFEICAISQKTSTLILSIERIHILHNLLIVYKSTSAVDLSSKCNQFE